jgi:acetyl esterase
MQKLLRSIPYQVQTAVMSAVFALPESARRLIAGPPIKIDGQELALDAQLLLRLHQLAGHAGLAAGTPEGARAAMTASVPLVAGPRIDLVDARDLLIPGDAGPIPARLYRPEGLAEGSPLLVYYHGGGWVAGDLESHDNLCRFLARHADVRVLAVDYRLAPEHPFPAAVDDALAAYRYAVAHAEELGVAPARIALGGDSAGGNLAAVTAYRSVRAGDPRPAFLMLIYPAVDATTRRRSRELFGHGFLLTDADMDWFMDQYCPDPQAHPDPRLSILLAEDLSVLPPTYLAMAGFDPLRDEEEVFAQRLTEAGVSVVVRRHLDLIHGYANMLGVGRRFREAVFEAVGALRAGLALNPATATGNGGPVAGSAPDRRPPNDDAGQVSS